MATDADMDIDMEIDPEVARMQAEADAINARAQQQAQEAAQQSEAMNGIEQAPEEGEVDPNAIVPFKVHLRGLDDLTTARIEEGVREICNVDFYQRLQWIDDTSANLVFDVEDAAADALAALSAEDETEPLTLRAVKPMAALEGVLLQARMAMEVDVKVAGAKDRSRFYLMNPDYDPDNRPRKRKNVRDHGPRHKRNRRESEDEAFHRRGSEQAPSFNVDLYDDAPAPEAAGRRSHDPASDRRRAPPGEDLFANRDNGRLRNSRNRDRSASPARDGDGRYGFSEEQPYRQTARQRSATPPRLRRTRENQEARLQRSQELFPSRATTTSTLKANDQAPRKPANAIENDLFLDRTTNGSKELFPDKALHRRHSAKDIDPDEVASAIGSYNFDGPSDSPSHTYLSLSGPGRAGRRPTNENTGPRDLFSRVSGGPQRNGSDGGSGFRIKGSAQDQGPGFSFKGASGPGFAIKGAGQNNATRERGANLAKELFPYRTGTPSEPRKEVNGGRDLFDGRIKGRGRKRAEDLF